MTRKAPGCWILDPGYLMADGLWHPASSIQHRVSGCTVRLLLVFVLLATMAACAHVGSGAAEKSEKQGAYGVLMDFYTGPLNHLSAVRAGSCPMYPSCSTYSRQAVKQYGKWQGWLMTVDRLIRCGRDEVRLAPKVWTANGWRVYDPLDNNRVYPQKPLSSKALQTTALP